MDFLNHREGGMVSYQVSLLSPLQCTITYVTVELCKRLREFEENHKRLREFEEKRKRLRDFEETEISRQSC